VLDSEGTSRLWAASGHCTRGSCSFFWAQYRRARSRAQNHTEELRGVSRRRNCEAFLRALPLQDPKIRKQLIKVLPWPMWQRDCFHTAAHIAARPHSALAIAASFRDARWQVAEAGKPLGQRSRCAASGHMDGLEAPIHRIFGPEWKERIAEPQAFIIFVAVTAKPTRGETAVAVPHRCGARGEVHRGQGGGCGTDENENAGEGSEPPDPTPPATRQEARQ
jgi:hypothetical protein